MNWDLLNDGLGNPKNTKSLLLSHSTPPSMITGIRPDAETAVRTGMKYIHFTSFTEEQAKAIDAYLKSLRPVPSPYLINGKLSAKAVNGRKIFEQAKCGTCHSGNYFSDGLQHDVSTGIGMEVSRKFDTPVLTEIWRTAPYLYDGRAATIEEVLTLFNLGDEHGVTSNLMDEEIAELGEYVLSQ